MNNTRKIEYKFYKKKQTSQFSYHNETSEIIWEKKFFKSWASINQKVKV